MFDKIVRFFLGRETRQSDRKFHAPEIGLGPERKALAGDLEIITIDNLMHFMSFANLSGELKIDAPNNTARFIIDSGSLVFGHLENNSLRIGERLLQKNCITPETLAQCLQIYQERGEGAKLGSILVEKGYLSREDLENAIKEQIKDIFFETLTWKKGFFSFTSCGMLMNKDIMLEERIDHLVLEGVINQDDKNNDDQQDD